MSRLARAALVLVLCGFVEPPSGWPEQPLKGSQLLNKASAVSHFGGGGAIVIARVFEPTDGPGALYVTHISAGVKDHRDEAARVEIDSFLAAGKRAQLANAKVTIEKSSVDANSTAKTLEAVLHWRDAAAGSETHARLVIAGDAERLIALYGECVAGPATTPDARAACDRALATLDPGIPPPMRVSLALVPEGSEPPGAAALPSHPPGRSGSSATPATMSETPAGRVPLPPMRVGSEPKRPVDRRPVYVGLGIVLLAAVFWWNRRRRDRFEAEGNERR